MKKKTKNKNKTAIGPESFDDEADLDTEDMPTLCVCLGDMVPSSDRSF
jgi:hypothetical protein